MLANSPTAIQDLQAYDELTQLKRTNPSFRLRNMREAPICFPPTYKYDHGSTNYDTSVKQRTPSWCDRILWRSQREASVQCVAYGRYEADVSDHRVRARSLHTCIGDWCILIELFITWVTARFGSVRHRGQEERCHQGRIDDARGFA